MTAVAAHRAMRPAEHARVARVLSAVALGVTFAIVLAALSVFVVLPRVTHGAALTVRTGSMAPALAVGSLVLVRSVDPSELKVGEIATYRDSNGDLITHRIVGVDRTGQSHVFTFRGDANPVADPEPVPASSILGRVWFDVPLLGTLRARVAAWRTAVVVVGILALGGYAIAQFTSYARDRRRRS